MGRTKAPKLEPYCELVFRPRRHIGILPTSEMGCHATNEDKKHCDRWKGYVGVSEAVNGGTKQRVVSSYLVGMDVDTTIFRVLYHTLSERRGGDHLYRVAIECAERGRVLVVPMTTAGELLRWDRERPSWVAGRVGSGTLKPGNIFEHLGFTRHSTGRFSHEYRRQPDLPIPSLSPLGVGDW
jgi:hypothetical protein